MQNDLLLIKSKGVIKPQKKAIEILKYLMQNTHK